VKPNLGRELDKGAFRRKIADQPTLLPVSGGFCEARSGGRISRRRQFQLLGERTKSTNPALRTSPETQVISAR
jgi:hypothetical protein